MRAAFERRGARYRAPVAQPQQRHRCRSGPYRTGAAGALSRRRAPDRLRMVARSWSRGSRSLPESILDRLQCAFAHARDVAADVAVQRPSAPRRYPRAVRAVGGPSAWRLSTCCRVHTCSRCHPRDTRGQVVAAAAAMLAPVGRGPGRRLPPPKADRLLIARAGAGPQARGSECTCGVRVPRYCSHGLPVGAGAHAGLPMCPI